MDIREISDHFDILSPLSSSTATNQLKKVNFSTVLSPSRRMSKDSQKLEKSLILKAFTKPRSHNITNFNITPLRASKRNGHIRINSQLNGYDRDLQMYDPEGRVILSRQSKRNRTLHRITNTSPTTFFVDRIKRGNYTSAIQTGGRNLGDESPF